MRKHLSVLALWAGSTLHWVLGIAGVTAGAQLLLFRRALAMAAEEPIVLDEAVKAAGIPLAATVGFVLFCALLSISGCALQGSRTEYTLRRLSVREESAVLWKAGYHVVCLLLFWAVQVGVLLLVCRWYSDALPAQYRSEQTAFLAVYRIEFFHGLLPLENQLVWWRNIVAVLGLALNTACFSFRQRRGKFSILPLLALLTVLWGFCGGVREAAVHELMILAICMWMAFDVYALICSRRGGEEDAG